MATMADVARQAGVSVSTVSYVLSGSRPIGDATKQRVLEAMSALDYHPNASARNLASRRTRVIAMLYPESNDPGATQGMFIHAAAGRARELGYNLVLWPVAYHEAQLVSDLVAQGQADGVLLMSVHLDDPRIDLLERARVPYAMIGRTRDVTGRYSVDIDFDQTINDTIGRLAALGHRQIAFLNHPRSSMDRGFGPTVRAMEVFERHTAARGITPVIRLCEDSPQAGREATVDLFDEAPDLTAIVTMNELATFGVFAELQRMGRRIPEDVSVIGIATSPGVSVLSNPPLTTMDAPGVELGRSAVDALVGQLDGVRIAPPPNSVIPCSFGEGMSIGPARDHNPVA